jgi:hypothetical protein
MLRVARRAARGDGNPFGLAIKAETPEFPFPPAAALRVHLQAKIVDQPLQHLADVLGRRDAFGEIQARGIFGR